MTQASEMNTNFDKVWITLTLTTYGLNFKS